jgi:PAS domain S-box-containing protein
MENHECNQAAALCRSNEWLEATLNSIADAVISTDNDYAVTSMNAVAERLTGWPLEQACGRRLCEVLVLCDGTTKQKIDCPVARLLREGGRGQVTLPPGTIVVRRDGTETPVEDSIAIIRERCGQPVGAVIVFRDVTARRREMARLAFLADASAELNASLDYETTLSTVTKLAVPAFADGCQVVMVVDGAPRPIAAAHVDPERVRDAFLHFDPCLLDQTLGAAHVIRTGLPELVPEISPEMIERAGVTEQRREWLRRLGPKSYIGVPLKRGGETIGAISLVMCASGRRHDASDLSVAVALAERAAIAVENARLFEEVRLARAEADARRSEAELANRSKDEFLAVLGHELRNPLAPIVSALDLMRRKEKDHESRERVIVERQVKHLCRLVDDLLDVSRIMCGKATLNRDPVEIAEVVTSAIDLVLPLIESRQHHVSVSVDPGLWVEGDAVRLTQVVSNLINNAAKYSATGAPIWIEAHGEDGEVVLSVRDRGIGIDPSVLPHVFEPFVQEPQALDRGQGGLGLGLAIARGLVELHGGLVSAHSDGPGRGSEFVVRLPARDRRVLDGSGDAQPGGASATPCKTRVLVVDDNEDALVLLVEELRLMGYEVVHAGDPLGALALARRLRPAVALLDIGLPEMDGYELARRMRGIDGLASIKLVAISGYGLGSDRARSADAGFDEHLVKPVTMDALQSTLERLTGAPAHH